MKWKNFRKLFGIELWNQKSLLYSEKRNNMTKDTICPLCKGTGIMPKVHDIEEFYKEEETPPDIFEWNGMECSMEELKKKFEELRSENKMLCKNLEEAAKIYIELTKEK